MKNVTHIKAAIWLEDDFGTQSDEASGELIAAGVALLAAALGTDPRELRVTAARFRRLFESQHQLQGRTEA